MTLLLAICAGCASKPHSISLAVVDDVSVQQVREEKDAHIGSTVRWGGAVTGVENRDDTTWVFVIARDLKKNGKPVSDNRSDGRFVAVFDGFVDPLVYKEGRLLTVVGSIDGSTTRAIGDYDYRFSLVSVRDSHLWPERHNTPRIYYPPPHHWYRNMYYYHPYPYPHGHW